MRAKVRSPQARSPADSLRATMAAVRVSFTWLGVKKTLSPDQKALAAEPFGAQEKFLSAAKKLLDTSHPLYREVTSLRSRTTGYWKAMTLPYPEPGLRLIPQDKVSAFNAVITEFRDALDQAVERLEEQYEVLKAAAQQRLGSLYDRADYPPSLRDLFGVEWEFPTVEPPEYLMRLNPAIYEQEKRRITARFDQAVKLAEEAFQSEFAKLVGHLAQRISGPEPQVFRDSAVERLKEFFARFRELNVHSNSQLDDLVATAQKAVEGIAAQDLRDSAALRLHVAGELSQVTTTLETLLIDAPRRKILRSTAAPAPPDHPPVAAAVPNAATASSGLPAPADSKRQAAKEIFPCNC